METEPYHLLFISGKYLNESWFSLGSLLGIIILSMLLFMSALVSGSEVAFFALSPNDKEKMKTTDDYLSRNILKLIDSPNRLLATILIANNFINIAIVIFSTYISSRIFDFSSSPRLGFFFQVVIVTFLLILFGEIIPKIYATGNTVRFCRFMSRGIKPLVTLFWPLSTVLLKINKRVKKYVSGNSQQISINDLSHMLELTDGAIAEDKEILEGIVKFGKTYVREVLKSRLDMVAVDISISFKELLDIITKSGYSRIPVYFKTLDDIKGLLYVKDLLPHLNQPSNFRWQRLVRPAYFVPDSKRISELLKEFQTNKIHMSLVIDEYGGIQGLVTLEDILEEIVGEIVDETDAETPLYKQIDKDKFVFEAKISLNDFYKIMDVPDDIFNDVKGEAETLAGLILEIKGEIPDKNVKVAYKYFMFEVVDVDDKRIRRIMVSIKRNTLNKEEK